MAAKTKERREANRSWITETSCRYDSCPFGARVNHFNDRAGAALIEKAFEHAEPTLSAVAAEALVSMRAFTLYPLGQVPYGRMSVAPVSCDGELLGSGDADPARGPRLGWQTTVFVAALQAASGQAWPRESDGIARIWDTQQELIARSAQLLGLAPNTPPRIGEQIAQQLQVPRLEQLAVLWGLPAKFGSLS